MDEDRCFKVIQTIECYVFADTPNEAERLAEKSTSNWDDWNVVKVESVVEVDEKTGEPI